MFFPKYLLDHLIRVCRNLFRLKNSAPYSRSSKTPSHLPESQGSNILGQIQQGTPDEQDHPPFNIIGGFTSRKEEATALLKLNRTPEARRVFEDILQRFPNKLDGHIGLAQIAARARNWPLALAYWESAHERFPAHLGALVGMANALRNLGRLQEAEGILISVIDRCPPAPTAYLILIAVANEKLDYGLALQTARAALSRFPEDYKVRLAECHALVANKNYEEANKSIALGSEQFHEVPDFFLAEAMLCARQYHYERSVAVLVKAAGIWPNSTIVAVKLAEGYLSIGKPCKARTVLENVEHQVEELKREQFTSVFLRALSQLDDLHGMESLLYSWRSQEDMSPRLHEWLVALMVRKGQDTDAVEWVDRFLEMAGDQPLTYGLQLRCFTLGERARGIHNLRKCNGYENFHTTFSDTREDTSRRLRFFCEKNTAHGEFNKHLGRINQRIENIALNFNFDYTNASVNPSEAYETLVKILICIQERVPMSLLRIGDGEGNFLNYPAHQKEQEHLDREEIQKLWWGEVRIDDHSWEGLRCQYLSAISSADILGVPDLMWRFLITAPEFLQTQELIPAQRGVLTAIEGLEEMAYSSDEPADQLGGRILTTAHISYDFAFWGVYDLIFETCGECSLITCHSRLGDWLNDNFEVAINRSYLIPGEYRWRQMFGGQHLSREWHFPDRFERICDEIVVNYPGEVFLVAAGFLGKFYCDIIKRRGGIALDIGSIVDQWLGYDTRGAELYNEFSVDYSAYFREILKDDHRIR
jgi:tetratricopeptide (TPR) repeat protein